MTFTYNGDPSASSVEEVRFWCQDTDSTVPLLSDEEINFLLGMWMPASDSTIFVAAVACEVIAAKFADEVSVSADGVTVATSDLQEKYTRLATRLREQYKAIATSSASPLVTGVLWDDSYDPSLRPLVFGIGLHDNYEAGRQDYGELTAGMRRAIENPLAASDLP